MEFKDKVRVKSETLEVYKVFSDGTKELAFSDTKTEFEKQRDNFLEKKKQITWRLD